MCLNVMYSLFTSTICSLSSTLHHRVTMVRSLARWIADVPFIPILSGIEQAATWDHRGNKHILHQPPLMESKSKLSTVLRNLLKLRDAENQTGDLALQEVTKNAEADEEQQKPGDGWIKLWVLQIFLNRLGNISAQSSKSRFQNEANVLIIPLSKADKMYKKKLSV